jgi:hypothetical protein
MSMVRFSEAIHGMYPSTLKFLTHHLLLKITPRAFRSLPPEADSLVQIRGSLTLMTFPTRITLFTVYTPKAWHIE